MVPRENKSSTYSKFWKTNKGYYGIFESGLLSASWKSRETIRTRGKTKLTSFPRAPTLSALLVI